MTWVHDPQNSPRSLPQVLIRLISCLLACFLLALQMERSLSPEVAQLCQFAGLNGLAFYLALELVADQRARQRQEQLAAHSGIAVGDLRLSYRLQEERRMAQILEAERRKKSRK